MGLSTNIIQIRRLNSIVPCRDCQHCDSCKTAGRCVQDDDLTRIVDDIRESDAIILVVSEETGAISLAYNANIYYNLSNATIKRTLLSLFSYKDVLPETAAKEGQNEAE